MSARQRISPVAANLAKLVRLLGSDKDGEVLAAVHALRRLLRAARADLHDVAQILEEETSARELDFVPDPQSWDEVVGNCLARVDLLEDRDIAFLRGVRPFVAFGGEPSEKQRAWIRSIWARLQRRLADGEAA